MATKKQKLTPSQDALERACGLFLVDVSDIDDDGNDVDITPVQQYRKLKKAQREGYGDGYACDFAEVCDAIENLTVDEVIGQVEYSRKSFLSLLQKHSKA